MYGCIAVYHLCGLLQHVFVKCARNVKCVGVSICNVPIATEGVYRYVCLLSMSVSMCMCVCFWWLGLITEGDKM